MDNVTVIVNNTIQDVTVQVATTGITTDQANQIITNTAKVGITPAQASNIVTNNAKITYPNVDSTKVGYISVNQPVNLDTIESDTLNNNAKITYPNVDSTKVGFISVTQAVDLDTIESDTALNNAKISFDTTSSTRLANTSGTNTGDQDLSGKVDKVTGYSLTKNDLTDILKTAYDNAVTWITTNGTNLLNHLTNTSNPHSVTKTQVGLGNVVNLDTTNASNITTGTLPSSVLPPVAITTVQVAVSEAAMLALTTEEGDVVVRSDENKSYMKNDGVVGDMTDFTELQTPTDSVLSVNGQTGSVVLTTTNVNEGTNLYYTDVRVDSNSSVTANTAKVGITPTQASDITTNNAKVGITPTQASDIVTNNAKITYPSVDSTKVGFISVTQAVNLDTIESDTATNNAKVSDINHVTLELPNVDNTSDVDKPVSTAQSTAIGVVQTDINNHEADLANPHAVTQTQVGLGNVDNTSDANKPISTATQTALDLKVDTTDATLTTANIFKSVSLTMDFSDRVVADSGTVESRNCIMNEYLKILN